MRIAHIVGLGWSKGLLLAASLLVPIVLFLAMAQGSSVDDSPLLDRDDSAAGVHARILVFDGWLSEGPLPCGSPERVLASMSNKQVGSGIWWLRTPGELAAARCWLRAHSRHVTLATRAGDPPRLHTSGRRSVMLGVLDAAPGDPASLHASGVRFARAPAGNSNAWLSEALRLGLAVEASRLSDEELGARLSRDSPSLIHAWSPAEATSGRRMSLLRSLGERRGGTILVLGEAGGTEIAAMQACLHIVRWPHCAIGKAADPKGLSRDLLDARFTEGNLSRLFGFNLLRVLQSAELWSGRR